MKVKIEERDVMMSLARTYFEKAEDAVLNCFYDLLERGKEEGIDRLPSDWAVDFCREARDAIFDYAFMLEDEG